MTILHIVNKSPHTHQALASAITHALSGSAILLIEDGVYGACHNTAQSCLIEQADQQLQFYALQADLQARGLMDNHLLDRVTTVTYDGFVDLVENHDTNQSWL